MASRTISSAWINGIAEKLDAAGLDSGMIFRQAGIDTELLAAADARIDCDKVSRLWEIAARRSGRPEIGILLGREARASSLDALLYVMVSCPTLHVALDRFVRYLRIVSEAVDITLHDVDRGCEIVLHFYGADADIPRQRVDFVLMTLIAICRWVCGRPIAPLEVAFTYPPPADLGIYTESFGGNLIFGADTQRILLSTSDLSHPLPASNAELAALHEKFAGECLSRLESTQIQAKVRDMIVRGLAGGEPQRGKIASQCLLSERTLQRRLQQEGTSYQELLDGTRRELAQQYLRGPLALGQVAYLLGFAEPSAFFRACRRWFGMAPGEYRKQQALKQMPR